MKKLVLAAAFVLAACGQPAPPAEHGYGAEPQLPDPQSSMLPVSQQTNASAFSQPPAPPTPVETAPPAPVIDPDAVARMPTVGR